MTRRDPETPLLERELKQLGVVARTCAWQDPVHWSDVPLVVCRTPWDYFHDLPAFLRWAESVGAATRLLNPPEVLAWNASKAYLPKLARSGVPTVWTAEVGPASSPGDRREALRRARLMSSTGLVVVKPAVSIGGLQARRGDTEHLRQHLDELAAEGGAVVQPFIESIHERGETSLVFLDGALSHCASKVPATDEFRVHLRYGGSVGLVQASPAELEVAESALAAVPATERLAYARVDLVEGSSGPEVIELELIDPELFFTLEPEAAKRFAEILATRIPRHD